MLRAGALCLPQTQTLLPLNAFWIIATSALLMQNTKALHRKLRNPRGFDLYRQAPRMLPHAYEPVRMDVAVEHTPEKVRGTGLPVWPARG